MNLAFSLLALVAITLVTEVYAEEQALFIKRDVLEQSKRVKRQTNADQMVQNILQWLQGVYTQNSRKSTFDSYYRIKHDAFRQGTLRQYLPPSNTQKPRPFQPVTTPQPTVPGGGYPPAGSITPQPPFPLYTNPATGGITGEGGYPSPTNDITPPGNQPDYTNGGYTSIKPPQPPFVEPVGPTGQPQSTGYPTTGGYPTPGPSTGYPAPGPSTGGYPTPGPSTGGYPTPGPSTGGYPTTGGYPSTGYPTPGPSTGGYPTPGPSTGGGYPTPGPSTGGYPTPGPSTGGYPTPGPSTGGYPTGPTEGSYTTGYPTPGPSTQKPGFATAPPPGFTSTSYPTQPPTSYPTQPPAESHSTDAPITSPPSIPEVTNPPEQFTSPPQTDDNNVIPGKPDNEPTDTENTGSTARVPTEEDLKHPPHIHNIDVQCAKDMMTINIEFNRQFDGVIYSKGFYNNPECRYVTENSGQTKYTFTVSLNSCGTEFINAFDTQGQSYLENVLVLQNEPGIQEVWDTIRSVRCLWEGNLKESLSVALSVGMLSQEIVTFSGDTAMAKLDIQLGRGPFAQPANGLVKIGETMTLVVSVSGDPGFDIQVKDCRAKDSTGDNVVGLTDDNGCVLKPKLFGAFQKTRNTGNSGASIIAYAFFSAFKFPDVMDLMIECNIELCKTDCEVCPDPNQKTEPGSRRKRDVYLNNQTIGDPITMGKHIRVILPEDLSDGKTILNLTANDGVCMTTQNFVFSSAILISILVSSSLFSAYMWLKNQRLSLHKL